MSLDQHTRWLEDLGVDVVVLDDPECVALLSSFVEAHPELWHEDIGAAD
jgi:cytosine deaminase